MAGPVAFGPLSPAALYGNQVSDELREVEQKPSQRFDVTMEQLKSQVYDVQAVKDTILSHKDAATPIKPRLVRVSSPFKQEFDFTLECKMDTGPGIPNHNTVPLPVPNFDRAGKHVNPGFIGFSAVMRCPPVFTESLEKERSREGKYWPRYRQAFSSAVLTELKKDLPAWFEVTQTSGVFYMNYISVDNGKFMVGQMCRRGVGGLALEMYTPDKKLFVEMQTRGGVLGIPDTTYSHQETLASIESETFNGSFFNDSERDELTAALRSAARSGTGWHSYFLGVLLKLLKNSTNAMWAVMRTTVRFWYAFKVAESIYPYGSQFLYSSEAARKPIMSQTLRTANQVGRTGLMRDAVGHAEVEWVEDVVLPPRSEPGSLGDIVCGVLNRKMAADAMAFITSRPPGPELAAVLNNTVDATRYGVVSTAYLPACVVEAALTVPDSEYKVYGVWKGPVLKGSGDHYMVSGYRKVVVDAMFWESAIFTGTLAEELSGTCMKILAAQMPAFAAWRNYVEQTGPHPSELQEPSVADTESVEQLSDSDDSEWEADD